MWGFKLPFVNTPNQPDFVLKWSNSDQNSFAEVSMAEKTWSGLFISGDLLGESPTEETSMSRISFGP